MSKILVIEDEPVLRQEIAECLMYDGFDVICAIDGVDGVNQAIHQIPDLIICDILMPRLDGYEVLLDIRSNSLTQFTPFIFMTAKAARDHIRAGMELGADDYLTKPFERVDLLRAVHTRLQQKLARDQNINAQVAELKNILAHERQQNMLKAKLIAMFSHDFRNPLTSIRTSNHLLLDYSDRMDQEQRLVHAKRIDAAVDQLLYMLDDVLMAAQMETGTLQFRPEKINVGQFIQRIVTDIETISVDTHHFAFENNLDKTVIADPRLLGQIAVNLITNAVKYSPAGSEISILLEDHQTEGILVVTDQGIGIPQDEQARLFEPFQRGSNVTGVSGTGLGLAIVKQAVEIYKGSIELESQKGIGTKFTVTFPISISQFDALQT